MELTESTKRSVRKYNQITKKPRLFGVFFYAKNGYMNAVRSDISLDTMVEKDGGYYWHDEVGDNTYFVVHICDRFYYYYEHY